MAPGHLQIYLHTGAGPALRKETSFSLSCVKDEPRIIDAKIRRRDDVNAREEHQHLQPTLERSRARSVNSGGETHEGRAGLTLAPAPLCCARCGTDTHATPPISKILLRLPSTLLLRSHFGCRLCSDHDGGVWESDHSAKATRWRASTASQ